MVICLPILAQPDVIRKAWKAGKHVISEKPVAKDVAAAKQLIAEYAALPSPKPVWAVAENYRFMEAVTLAADKIKEIGGETTFFSFDMFTMVKTDNKYYNTACKLSSPLPLRACR